MKILTAHSPEVRELLCALGLGDLYVRKFQMTIEATKVVSISLETESPVPHSGEFQRILGEYVLVPRADYEKALQKGGEPE